MFLYPGVSGDVGTRSTVVSAAGRRTPDRGRLKNAIVKMGTYVFTSREFVAAGARKRRHSGDVPVYRRSGDDPHRCPIRLPQCVVSRKLLRQTHHEPLGVVVIPASKQVVMVELVVELVQDSAFVEAIVLWDDFAITLPKSGA